MTDFTEEKMREFQAAYDLYDVNKDGLLDMESVDSVFKCLGYDFSEKEIYQFFFEYGIKSDPSDNFPSKINFDSFISFLNKLKKEEETEPEIIKSFREFDKDGDGVLNKKELKYLLLSLGEDLNDEELEEFIAQIDTTGSGSINYKDFISLMLMR